ncbi:MAG: Ni-sirohydrochlorin a,c-diamide synthase [Methanimicrococcus sp.]|nr:Ni-sirohydrochlorin a,c-diamide synthase [Methanimicrococcus sp.]
MIENIPRILIAADRSSSGKTTITMGISAALKERGYAVQPFKAALDYIDPEYHTEIAGRRCRNLDGYLMSDADVRDVFTHACRSHENGGAADIAVIEGVRGLFEGLDAFSDVGSTAQIAKILKCPVVMVINARSMTRSCAALIKGFCEFDPEVQIAGVILNNIGSPKHARKAIEAVEFYTGVPVIGTVFRNPELAISSRELGLIPIAKGRRRPEDLAGHIQKMKDGITGGIDFERLIGIADTAEPFAVPPTTVFQKNDSQTAAETTAGAKGAARPAVKIGVAYDEAFNFYYADNLDLLEIAGAELVYFSPIHDFVLPEVHALYIGGGVPDIFAKQLADNVSMRASIQEASKKNMPIFAESAGMDYLTRKIEIADKEGNRSSFEMAGVFPCTSAFGVGRRIVSYTNGVFESDTPIGKKGNTFIAHEFHHSVLENIPTDTEFAIKITRGVGISNQADGMTVQNTIGTYTHFHGVSYKEFAENFIASARNFKDLL